MQVLDNLPAYLDRFSARATRAGAVVHRAKDGETARDIVFNILKDHGAKKDREIQVHGYGGDPPQSVP